MSETWEALRKKARSTENSIDVKLVSLNKLTASSHGGFDIDEKTVSSRQTSFKTVTTEIEGLIEQLTNINDDMNDVAGAQSSASWANNPAIQHTLRRHREILRDYGSEYRRARDNVDQVLQRELLLSSSNENRNNPILNNRARGYDMYLKENDHINACDRLLDEQLEMAMSTKENMARQGINLRGISTRLHHISKKYPAINNLMQKIKTKKQKNTLILAAVISSCLIFTIFWIIN
ncbi:Golgi SNAP receptor complex member 1 [Caenorhabditis elegans]|uniref:Golgi SNAP receptor complex member 1 n=1 Tax=Caenorhabditis elegans TaxID=6239 RepID=GOSR1_CAEEL|nr:Golgi SNAP receptor complex member 1 [Caenorhabditis elegans]Q95ZW1.1 RecName: Full=Golgi SNAP receptor complex member 1; AltName: Full=28 kDa Golgi SNARE protein; Short=GOS-28 [Caenorhabditis elegans]CCD69065.1 Golgi SNAP receptor complex member 1 [Caenorhabditis elegans]|eukprot:NP_498621.1 Golgi SNAP receptor complex member 1 [Caenorhabditis elegans]